ncbi:MAG: protein kinase [Jaaginema sp. PMC 1079.18]|nr:protein kinase [Jaaginema sp. PMC 1080.18]MEC4852100.1 protein kinase [Jaaginema sp. PMC 1079.18]MEC4868693.1 protein kinase [Jaaginema sp. PMC 1078.18]
MFSLVRPGTILDRRYCAIAILAQKADRATYLAQDRGRFNELCILKGLNLEAFLPSELPQVRDRFLRGVNQLYHLQHRQLPGFRATFKAERSWFFVQDYIEGQSLADIWQSRQSQNRTLTEGEVRELCWRLLPILDYLHRQDCLGNQLVPRHIILHPTVATPNHLEPVFIGLDARDACSETPPSPYSPPELVQDVPLTPSSDLYRLGAIAVTLLTGKDPETLYDSETQTWHWQPYTEASEELATVLTRMLQPQPRDRYPSVLDVLQALQPPPIVKTAAEPLSPPEDPPDGGWTTLPESTPALRYPGVSIGLTLGLGLIAGIGAWLLVASWLKSPQPTTAVPSKLPAVATAPNTPATPEPNFRERLTIPPGQVLQQSGTLPPDTTAEYIVQGAANQELAIALASEGIWLTLLKPNREIVEISAELVKNWQGRLSESGDYVIQLIAIPGLPPEEYEYQLEVALSGAVAPSEVDSSPLLSPTPSEPEETSVTLSAITKPLEVQGQTSPQRRQSYFLPLETGKTLEVEVLSGRVKLNIYSPDGEPIDAAQGVEFWQGKILRGGQYRLEAIAPRPQEFTLGLRYLDP